MWLYSKWNKEAKKKKKNVQERKLDGLLPIFQLWSRHNRIVSRQAGRRSGLGHDTA